MDILYLLIPISLIIMGIAIAVFLWAIRSGQFEDLKGPRTASLWMMMTRSFRASRI